MELFKTKPRRSNGQFATREMAYADMQAKENERLKFESEQWRRMYLAVVNDNVKMERELKEIKQALAKLQNNIHT